MYVLYIGFQVPVYLHYLECSICGRKCDILKKKISLTQPQLAAILLCCNLHYLLPIFQNSEEALVCGTWGSSISLWFIVIVLKMQYFEKAFRQTQSQLSATWFHCCLHNPLLIFWKSEETVLLPWWRIRSTYIPVIFNIVFVVGNADCEKEFTATVNVAIVATGFFETFDTVTK